MSDKAKILVVDDEAVIRDLMVDILADEGFEIATASSGAVALDMLAHDPHFVLLFTDIMMPEMGGIDLIRAARKLHPSIIPIVMTGFATLETARDAVREGAYDYVLKPFSLSEIRLAVTNAIERYRLMNENARLRELTELFNISERIASIHDENILLDFVLRATLDRVGAERGSLMLMNPDGNRLEVATSVGSPEDAAGAVELGASVPGWVAKHGKPLLIEDAQASPELKEMIQGLPDASLISVPLEGKTSKNGRAAGKRVRHGTPVLAVLNVRQKRGNGQFTESDLKTVSIVANHAAVAIENVRLLKDVEDAHLATLRSMALLLEAKDAYTHGHSQRVSEYAVCVACEMGMSRHDIETLRLGGALHDLGKVGISDAVLNKETKLSDDEWESIKRHPVIGYDVLAPVSFLTKGHLALVRSHHERIDGQGYPDRLSGDQIFDLARVLAIADSYDAMSSDRAYRKAMTPDQIVTELKRCSGTQFDAAIAGVFIGLIESGRLPNCG